MGKLFKKEIGITLIALVITIVILIILAGVAINLSIGENGIFNKAKYAKQDYLNSQEAEQEKINDLYSQMMIATNSSSQITVNVEDLKTIMQQQILNSYPIGSIYISTSETNPSEFIGGTWESYGQGRTLVGAGSGTDTNNVEKTFTINSTGGEYEHTLTKEEMPSHSHKFIDRYWKFGDKVYGFGGSGYWMTSKSEECDTQSQGGDQAHNNIQPYIVTYMWKRIS